MKKQVIYPKFIPRLFSATIDMFLLSIVSPFIMNIFAKITYSTAFKDYISKVQSENGKPESIAQIFYNPEFFEYVSTNDKMGVYLFCVLTLTIINFLLMGVYFVSFWKYFSATPGKLLMGMKIVDANTQEAPSTYQLIKRFCGYLTALFGIWGILFTAHRQALHDKISSTMVIKA